MLSLDELARRGTLIRALHRAARLGELTGQEMAQKVVAEIEGVSREEMLILLLAGEFEVTFLGDDTWKVGE